MATCVTFLEHSVRMSMPPTATDRVAWSVDLYLSVCLSMSDNHGPGRTSEPIDVSFEMRTHVGPKNHDRDPDPRGQGQL